MATSSLPGCTRTRCGWWLERAGCLVQVWRAQWRETRADSLTCSPLALVTTGAAAWFSAGRLVPSALVPRGLHLPLKAQRSVIVGGGSRASWLATERRREALWTQHRLLGSRGQVACRPSQECRGLRMGPGAGAAWLSCPGCAAGPCVLGGAGGTRRPWLEGWGAQAAGVPVSPRGHRHKAGDKACAQWPRGSLHRGARRRLRPS